jgi:hypothetical protein
MLVLSIILLFLKYTIQVYYCLHTVEDTKKKRVSIFNLSITHSPTGHLIIKYELLTYSLKLLYNKKKDISKNT